MTGNFPRRAPRGLIATRLKVINCAADAQVGHRAQFLDLHHPVILPMQPYDLIAPFLQMLQRRVSCVIFFNDYNIVAASSISSGIVPSQ